MRKRARRLALMGQIPASAEYFKKHNARSVADQLARDGWLRCGGGCADPRGLNVVYHGYMRESFVDVPRRAAVPKYGQKSMDPEYWMYGKILKRHYIFHYLADDRIEERGVSNHKTEDTLTFPNSELKWCGNDTRSWDYD